MKRYSGLAAVLLFSVSLSAFAQQAAPSPQSSPAPSPQANGPQRPGAEDDIVRITTNLVQVDAVVTDKSGKIVTDLAPEEIQIFEDGRRQTVTHFSYVRAESRAPAEPAAPATADKVGAPVP